MSKAFLKSNSPKYRMTEYLKVNKYRERDIAEVDAALVGQDAHSAVQGLDNILGPWSYRLDKGGKDTHNSLPSLAREIAKLYPTEDFDIAPHKDTSTPNARVSHGKFSQKGLISDEEISDLVVMVLVYRKDHA